MCLEPHPGELLNRRSLCPPFQWLRDLYSWGLRSGGYTPPSLASQTPVAPKDIKWLYLALFYPFYVLRAVRGKKKSIQASQRKFLELARFCTLFQRGYSQRALSKVIFPGCPTFFSSNAADGTPCFEGLVLTQVPCVSSFLSKFAVGALQVENLPQNSPMSAEVGSTMLATSGEPSKQRLGRWSN